MSTTRREFTAATIATVSLAVLGCDSNAQPPAPGTGTAGPGAPPPGPMADDASKKSNLAKEPFTIGAASKYAKAGLYEDYKKDKGVWIISDGKALVVLSASCTHLNCTTNWVTDDKVFLCPCHKSRFGLDGAQKDGSKAKRPLERCALKVIDTKDGAQVQVDPTHRFRQDKGEWSNPDSSLALT